MTNVTLAVAGGYSVVITDAIGAITSRVARLEVDPAFTKITTGAIVTDRGANEGMAWVDYDGDGLLDLFSGTGNLGPNNFLYRNNGDGTFTRMTSAMVGSVVQTQGEDCAWGDYDNDGYLDVFVWTCSSRSTVDRVRSIITTAMARSPASPLLARC